MSRDYKPAASRSSKSGGNKGNPFLSGLLVGLLLGVGISVGVAILVKGSDSPFVSRGIPAKHDVATEESSAVPKDAIPAAGSDKPRFDFYTILPGTEAQVTEQEIKRKEEESTSSKTQESYFLQVGAFKTEQEADNMKAKLALLGMEAIVQTAAIPDKGTWHRVRVGPFSDLDQINKARGELTRNNFSTDLIKVKTPTAE